MGYFVEDEETVNSDRAVVVFEIIRNLSIQRNINYSMAISFWVFWVWGVRHVHWIESGYKELSSLLLSIVCFLFGSKLQ